MLGARLRLRRDVPRLRHRAAPMDRPRRQEPRVESRPHRDGPGGILKPQALGGWMPLTINYEGDPRHRRRRPPRDLLRADHLHLVVVAEARPGQDRRDRGVLVRSTAGEEVVGTLTDGADRRQPADDALHRRVHARRGRRRLPHQGRQAEAVHPHRPDRVHHVRGLRRHLPVEVHPHGQAGGDRRGDRHRASRRGPVATRSCSRSTTTSAPGARCASTAARRA